MFVSRTIVYLLIPIAFYGMLFFDVCFVRCQSILGTVYKESATAITAGTRKIDIAIPNNTCVVYNKRHEI